jgi:small-conductance mechanosensitive channel
MILELWETVQEIITTFVSSLPLIALALVVFGIFYLLSIWSKYLVRRVARAAHLAPGLEVVLQRISRWTIVLLGLLVALNIVVPTFTTGELIQLLGFGGVAVGFLFRDIFENFLAGIIILLNEPFRVGDQIIYEEFEGTIEEIETRATHIRTYDGRRVIIPNGKLFTGVVLINTAFEKRRSEYDVGIGYGDDITTAVRIILEAIEEIQECCETPSPDVIVMRLDPSSVALRARWWTESSRGDVLTVRSRVITAIKQRLMDNGIDLPFPTRQILFHDQTEAVDGNRRLQREGWPAGPGPVPEPRTIALALEERAGETAGLDADRKG